MRFCLFGSISRVYFLFFFSVVVNLLLCDCFHLINFGGSILGEGKELWIFPVWRLFSMLRLVPILMNVKLLKIVSIRFLFFVCNSWLSSSSLLLFEVFMHPLIAQLCYWLIWCLNFSFLMYFHSFSLMLVNWQFQYTPQHTVRLLHIIVDGNCDMAVRQVASIHFKNFIAKNWSPHEPGLFPFSCCFIRP